MKPKDYADIRKRWELTQEQMAVLMAVSGKLVISHYERGFRSPSAIIQKLYRMMDDLPEHDAQLLMKWLEKFGADGSDQKSRKR